MPINMTDYRMIINERVYNVLQIMIEQATYHGGSANERKCLRRLQIL